MLNYLLVIIGIISGQIIQLPILVASLILAISAIILVFLYVYGLGKHQLKIYLLMLALFSASFGYSNWRIDYRKALQLTHPISGIALNAYINSPIKNTNNNAQAIFQVIDGKFAGQNFLLNYPESYNIKAGYNYALSVRLKPIGQTTNPHAFDFQQYLLTKNISGLGYINSYTTQHKANYSPSSQITKVRISMINYLSTTLINQKYAGFFIALVTGYQGLIPNEQWDIFRHTGINHIVSISGLHITLATTLFVILINLLLKYLPPTQMPRQIILAWSGVFFAIIYALFAGFSIPTQRALYMIIISAYLLANRRYIPLIYQLIISLAFVLVFDPFAVSSIGFWFSYLLVAAIFITIATDKPDSGKIITWVRMQIIITICGIPLSLYYFASVSVSSMLANLWVVPVIGSVFTPLVLVTSILHIDILIKITANLMTYAMLPIELLAKVPMYWQIRPNIYSILISYIGLALFIIPLPLRGKNILALCLVGNVLFSIQSYQQNYATARIHVFSNPNVGFAVVSTKKHNVLLMTHNGAINLNSSFNSVVAPYLRAQNIKQLDYVISNRDESDFYDYLNMQRFRVMNIDFDHEQSIDGVDFALHRQNDRLALLVKSAHSMNYLGNCLPVDNPQSINNMFILMPNGSCSWLLSSSYDNLYLNYGYQQQRQMDYILNNLSLQAKNSYDLYNNTAENLLSQ